jgi:nuclear GTP-binding protein
VSIAPGAENVGQAQIVSEFSKPFELEGLFGAADASAFGNAQDGGTDEVMADADGDVWWYVFRHSLYFFSYDIFSQDKVMADEEVDQRDLTRTRKRTRSPSPTTVAETIAHPPRKRRRRLKDDGDTTPHPQMAGRGPLSRAMLKRERKKTRRAARKSTMEETGGMDVDVWEGLGGVLEGVFKTGTVPAVGV